SMDSANSAGGSGSKGGTADGKQG
ncbi:Flp family type IVb pilin, partial [Vibrio parahaemolyticus]